MSNRKTGWTFSVERPVAVQSPSTFPLTDIQAKLNFSTVKSPMINPKKVSLMNVDRHPEQSSVTPLRNRLADYHMSKQNPDVLDRMYSSSLPSSPMNGYRPLNNNTFTPSVHHNRSINSHSGMGLSFQNRVTHTPVQMSLLRQTMKSARGQGSFGLGHTSLVQLATQKGSLRMNGSPTISPVVVRLSRKSEPPSEGRGDSESMSLFNGDGSSMENGLGNPCDKDVVLSALRRRRKRWATSGPDEGISSSNGPPVSGQPLAKRSRHTLQPSTAPLQSFPLTTQSTATIERKRPHSYSTAQQSSPTSKKSKVTESTVRSKCRNKIRVPDIEYESDTEHAQITQLTVETANSNEGSNDREMDGVRELESDKWRDQTPAVPVENDEMIKKREHSLSILKSVFPSVKKSLRREVPVFCSTGQKPHMPAPLSDTHSATQEDLRKDREAAAKKLREFLTAADDKETASSSSLGDSSRTGSVSAPTVTCEAVSTVAKPLSGVKLSTTQTSDLLKAPAASLLSNKVSLTPTVPEQSITNITVSTAPKDAGNVAFTLSTADTSKIGMSALKTSSTLQSAATKNVSFANPPVRTSSNEGPGASSIGSLPSGLKLGGLQNSAPLTGGSLTLQASSLSVASAAVSGLPLPVAIPGSLDSAKPMQNVLQQPQQLKLPTLSTANSLQFGTAPTTQQSALPPPAMTASLQFGVASTQPVNVPSQNSVPSMQSSLQLPQKPAPTLSGTNDSSVGTAVQGGFTFKMNSATGPGVQTQPGNSTALQKPGGLSLATQTQPGNSTALQKPGGLSLATKPGLSFGVQSTQQPSGGLLFGNSTQVSASQDTQKSINGLSFGKNTTSTQGMQQPGGGLLFGNSTASTQASTLQGTQQPGGGLLFGNSTASTQASTLQGMQQPSGGLLFGNSTASTQASTSQGLQQPGGGLLFGNSTASTQAATSQGMQQPSGGLLFGNSTASTQASTLQGTQQPGGGLLFGNNQASATNGVSGSTGNASLSFGGVSSVQPKQINSMFGMQATNQGSKPTGLSFGKPGTQTGTSSNFSFSASSAGGSQQQNGGMFSSGNAPKPQSSLSFNFGGNNQTPQNGNSIFNGGTNTGNMQSKETQPANAFFGGIAPNLSSTTNSALSTGFNFSASPAQVQQKTNGGLSSGFSFSGGSSQPMKPNGAGAQQPSQTGLLNFGQSGQSGFNFGSAASGMGIGPSSGTSGFAFNVNSGMNGGQSALNAGNSASKMSQGGAVLPFGGQGTDVFSSPQPGLQAGSGFSFTPSAQQTPSQGFNFCGTTPNNSSVNFGFTPTANLFAAGAQGESTPRSTTRARRRSKKK